jgi:hypothetical protein
MRARPTGKQRGVDVDMLTNDQILTSGAYALDRPPREGEGLAPKDELWKRYEAHFVRDWPIADEVVGVPQIWRHSEHPSVWSPNFWAELTKLEGNLRSQGLINPVLVTWKNGHFHLHPGKCRVFALKNLGIDTVPAIVTWHGRTKHPNITAEYEIRSAEQLKEHFKGDIAPEMTRRGIRTPKIR